MRRPLVDYAVLGRRKLKVRVTLEARLADPPIEALRFLVQRMAIKYI